MDLPADVKVPCPTCGEIIVIYFTPRGTLLRVAPHRTRWKFRSLRVIDPFFCDSLTGSRTNTFMAKRTASADTLKPDPRFHSILAAKFINCLMWQGKKATAQRIFYDALEQIKKRMPDAEPIDIFTQAVKHVKPTVEVRSKRVGGATYQVPMQVNDTRQQSLAIRWILGASARQGGPAHVSAPRRGTHGRLPP